MGMGQQQLAGFSESLCRILGSLLFDLLLQLSLFFIHLGGSLKQKAPLGEAGLNTTSRPLQVKGWGVNVSSSGRYENEKPCAGTGQL